VRAESKECWRAIIGKLLRDELVVLRIVLDDAYRAVHDVVLALNHAARLPGLLVLLVLAAVHVNTVLQRLEAADEGETHFFGCRAGADVLMRDGAERHGPARE